MRRFPICLLNYGVLRQDITRKCIYKTVENLMDGDFFCLLHSLMDGWILYCLHSFNRENFFTLKGRWLSKVFFNQIKLSSFYIIKLVVSHLSCASKCIDQGYYKCAVSMPTCSFSCMAAFELILRHLLLLLSIIFVVPNYSFWLCIYHWLSWAGACGDTKDQCYQ